MDSKDGPSSAHPIASPKGCMQAPATPDTLSSRVKSLERELALLTRIGRNTQEALKEALDMAAELRQENTKINEALVAANAEKASIVQRIEPQRASEVSMDRESAISGPSSSVTSQAVQTSPRAELLSLSAQDFAPSVKNDVIKQELADLYAKYEALRAAKERNDAKHAKDYEDWRKFKDWICTLEDDGDDTKTPGTSSRKKRGRRHATEIRERYAKMRFHAPSNSDGYGDIVKHTSMIMPTNVSDRGAETPRSRKLLTPVTAGRFVKSTSNRPEQPALPELFLDVVPKEEPLSPTHNLASDSPTRHRKRKRVKSRGAGSSETEDDSQAPFPMRASQLAPRPRESVARTPSTSRSDPQKSLLPTLKAEQDTDKDALLISDPIQDKPPTMQKSEDTPAECRVASTSMNRSSSTSTSKSSSGLQTPKKKASTSKENGSVGKVSTSSTRKHPADYSIYKGRGRYAVAPQSDNIDTTINALFEIDTTRNSGLDFQFNEVVRDKSARQKLHGSNCPCCQEYYEAIGPLPLRQQAPLWRSPESTPTKAQMPSTSLSENPFTPTDSVDEDDQTRIGEHIHQISRHREQWERSKTPPGYWNIGFPDTQQAAEINERAKGMHQEKMAMINNEARQGGRFKRRKL